MRGLDLSRKTQKGGRMAWSNILNAIGAVTGSKHTVLHRDYLPQPFIEYARAYSKAHPQTALFKDVHDWHEYTDHYQRLLKHKDINDTETEFIGVKNKLIHDFYGFKTASYSQRRRANHERMADIGDLHPNTQHNIVSICTAGMWELQFGKNGFAIAQHHLKNDNIPSIMWENLYFEYLISWVAKHHATYNCET